MKKYDVNFLLKAAKIFEKKAQTPPEQNASAQQQVPSGPEQTATEPSFQADNRLDQWKADQAKPNDDPTKRFDKSQWKRDRTAVGTENQGNVKLTQKALNAVLKAKGLLPKQLGEDGVLGPATRAALITYRDSKGQELASKDPLKGDVFNALMQEYKLMGGNIS